MDRALLVECSDEINEAASSPSEEELFRELDEKVKTIAEVVDGMKAAVSAIPDIQDDMEQIKKTLEELVSYSKSIVMDLGSYAAKGGPLFDENISKHLLPVSTVFTAEYVGLAASSTMPKVFAYSSADRRPSR
jgi:hypothetical protein